MSLRKCSRGRHQPRNITHQPYLERLAVFLENKERMRENFDVILSQNSWEEGEMAFFPFHSVPSRIQSEKRRKWGPRGHATFRPCASALVFYKNPTTRWRYRFMSDILGFVASRLSILRYFLKFNFRFSIPWMHVTGDKTLNVNYN